MRLYISGPMSGIKGFNIEAFDMLAAELRRNGHQVISPAELDDAEFRAECLASEDGNLKTLNEPTRWGDLIGRDIARIANDWLDGIVVLPGWGTSQGALLETFLARLLGLGIYSWDETHLHEVKLSTLELFHGSAGRRKPKIEIIEEGTNPNVFFPVKEDGKYELQTLPEGPIKRAHPLVHGDRQKAYGHPSEDFARTAGMWKSMFGWDVKTKDVPLAMICVKLSRLQQTPNHPDSLTDICGYAETAEMCAEAEPGIDRYDPSRC